MKLRIKKNFYQNHKGKPLYNESLIQWFNPKTKEWGFLPIEREMITIEKPLSKWYEFWKI